MKQAFLRFESDGISFLLPLNEVGHIVPNSEPAADPESAANSEPAAVPEPEAIPMRIISFRSLLNRSQEFPEAEQHRIMLKREDGSGEDSEPAALSVDRVNGVVEAEPEKMEELPRQVIWEKNRFLEKVVFLEEEGVWAYLLRLKEVIQ